MPAFPDLTLFFMGIYGGFGYVGSADDAYLGLASGMPQTGNPPYGVMDFISLYPKFLGVPVSVTGTITAGSVTIAGVTLPPSVAVGQLIAGTSIAPGTAIAGLGAGAITLSAPAIADGATCNIYTAALVPLAAVQVYLNLAYASLMSSRWREAWPLAMGLYIAHFMTLFLQTDGTVQTTAGQAVQNGLQQGIRVSQGADGLNMATKPLAGLDTWAAWNLTSYGVSLITMAKCCGAGATYIR